jgi:uncharacterized membrane protein
MAWIDGEECGAGFGLTGLFGAAASATVMSVNTAESRIPIFLIIWASLE